MLIQWIKIKGQLVNINNFDTIEWKELADSILSLQLSKCVSRVTSPVRLDFCWDIKKFDPVVIEEINSISYDISNATCTIKPVFNHDLAENDTWDGTVVDAIKEMRNETVNPNAEFIGE